MYRIIKRCNCHAKYDTKYIQGGWNEENTVRHFQDRICCNLNDSVVMIVEKSLLKIIVWTGVESFQQFSKNIFRFIEENSNLLLKDTCHALIKLVLKKLKK